jgi:major membrane immunogen (membrane-anchored lipoprotein)
MSMSVKNRVAMFEGGKDSENPMSPKGPSIKRPSTPNSFKRPATPTSPAFGQVFLKAVSPSKAKPFNGKDLKSPTGRSSWHLPAEGSVIPAPDMILSSKTGDNRRFSSSATTPVVLTQKSPMSKSSVVNVPFAFPRSSSKYQTTSNASPLSKRVQSAAPKPVMPLQLNAALPVSSENRAPKSSESATKNKALQLAKSRNSLNTKPSKGDVQSIVCDDDALSRNSDPELRIVNGHTMTSDEKSRFTTNMVYDASDSLSMAAGNDTYASGSFGQLSRAGKLSQAQRRSTTPDPVRSPSPLPAVRGAMTLSNVSHKEARKALLQAAQRKKERTDAIKQEEKEKEKQVKDVTVTEEPFAEDVSKRSEGSIADRVATKAMNVLKMKNSVLFGDIKTKGSSDVAENHRDTEGSCNGSVTSTSSRLKTHPAFAARAASPRLSSQVARSLHLMTGAAKTYSETKVVDTPKAFTEELFSNIRHFNDLRPERTGANSGAFQRFLHAGRVFLAHNHILYICRHSDDC